MPKKKSPMSAHRGIEIALEQTPPSEWNRAASVTRALITCPRARSMARNHLRRFGVSTDYVEEVIQDSAMAMQRRVLFNGMGEQPNQLREIADVYFVLYRVIELTVRNYQKKASYAASNMLLRFSEVQFTHESQEEMMGRLIENDVDDGGFERVDRRIDAQNSRNKLKAKLEKLGWPAHISRERSVRGRPSKQ